MKFSIKDLFTKLDQIRRKQRIWSDLLKKSLMENFIFCAVKSVSNIIVWKLHLETITYFVWPERLEMIAHFYHFEYGIGMQYFSH